MYGLYLSSRQVNKSSEQHPKEPWQSTKLVSHEFKFHSMGTGTWVLLEHQVLYTYDKFVDINMHNISLLCQINMMKNHQIPAWLHVWMLLRWF